MKKEEATMKKTEAPTKKSEAKEEGAVSKHIRVVYSDKRKRGIICSIASIVLLIICVSAFGYICIQPRVPLFILDDLYVDSVSNSSLMVSVFNLGLTLSQNNQTVRFWFSIRFFFFGFLVIEK